MYTVFCALFLLAFCSSSSKGLACYEHHERCVPTRLCVIDANRKNCSSSNHRFCFKDDIIFQMAIRGCAERDFCNTSLLIGSRYCCQTDYCNRATNGVFSDWLLVFILLLWVSILTK